MKTLTEKFNAVLEGKFSKKQFVRDARLAHPQLITQYNGYDDTVAILKNRGYIFEQIEKYKEEKLPAYDNGVTEADKHPLEAIERGVDYELEKKGFNTIQPDFSEDDYEKAKKKVIDNLEKNPNHYLNILADEPTRVQKNRKDVMKPVEKNNHVDKDNGMVKAELKESVNEDLGTIALGVIGGIGLYKILKFALKKVGVAVGSRVTLPKETLHNIIDETNKALIKNSIKGDKTLNMMQIATLRKLLKDYVDDGTIKSAKDIQSYSERAIKAILKPDSSVNEGRRPKSKGGKVVKEDDYANGGYVEMMSADLDKGIRLVQKAWDDWKSGPLTEPAMIEHAKEDLIRHIHDSLTFFDEEDTVMETDIEGPLEEKKAQLKETFKKLIVKVLTEDKKKVNEEIKGAVDLSKYEPQVADEIKKVDPTVQKVDVKLSHQEGAELAHAEIMVVPGDMDVEELRNKTIGNPKQFFTGGLRRYFINTLKNVNIEMKDGNLHISFDFYVNPFAGEQGKQFDPAFTAKMKRGDYGRLDEKDSEQKGFTLDGKVL